MTDLIILSGLSIIDPAGTALPGIFWTKIGLFRFSCARPCLVPGPVRRGLMPPTDRAMAPWYGMCVLTYRATLVLQIYNSALGVIGQALSVDMVAD